MHQQVFVNKKFKEIDYTVLAGNQVLLFDFFKNNIFQIKCQKMQLRSLDLIDPLSTKQSNSIFLKTLSINNNPSAKVKVMWLCVQMEIFCVGTCFGLL